MKFIVLPLAVLVMLALVAVAFAWDCVRLEHQAAERLAVADAELTRPEQRLVATLNGLPEVPADVTAALATYRAAQTRPERHAAYADLQATTERSLVTSLDATNPLSRRVMDEVAGAINRRTIAEKTYAAQQSQYQAWQQSFRGRVASVFTGGGDR